MENLNKTALLLAVSLTALLASGCSLSGSENDTTPSKTYKIIEIDGHEYIFISRRPWSGEMALAHSGNCKNVIHNH